MGQPTSPTQHSIPLGSSNVVILVITSIAGVETIKRQTRVAYGWLVVGQSVGAGLAYGLCGLFARCVCEVQRRCSCGMWLVALYNCNMPLRLCADAVVCAIDKYLDRVMVHGAVTLDKLMQIETKVVEDLQLSAFATLEHGTFLQFMLSQPQLKKVIIE